jgi:hypothetical protein
MQEQMIQVDDILAFVDDFAPEEAAAHLARLDDRLTDVVLRAPASAQQQAVRGMAYRLLRDALTRRATSARLAGGQTQERP